MSWSQPPRLLRPCTTCAAMRTKEPQSWSLSSALCTSASGECLTRAFKYWLVGFIISNATLLSYSNTLILIVVHFNYIMQWIFVKECKGYWDMLQWLLSIVLPGKDALLISENEQGYLLEYSSFSAYCTIVELLPPLFFFLKQQIYWCYQTVQLILIFS